MYILKCANDSYYTGSTKQLDIRVAQHQAGEGAIHTKKYGPVELVYWEEYDRIDTAFYREKQVQGWSRKKKETLINRAFDRLSHLSKNYTQYGKSMADFVETTDKDEVLIDGAFDPSTGSGSAVTNRKVQGYHSTGSGSAGNVTTSAVNE